VSITFNADDIFQMAEEIERNGAKFYRQAATQARVVDMKKFFNSMAKMEDHHLAVFKQMRKDLKPEEKDPTVYDPQDESIQYLQAMADSHGFEGRVSPTIDLSGSESMKEVIAIAINAEKESVVFYSGLKSLVPGKSGYDKIEKIILEELSHITTLLKYLKSSD
jgi:rubrerythrin